MTSSSLVPSRRGSGTTRQCQWRRARRFQPRLPVGNGDHTGTWAWYGLRGQAGFKRLSAFQEPPRICLCPSPTPITPRQFLLGVFPNSSARFRLPDGWATRRRAPMAPATRCPRASAAVSACTAAAAAATTPPRPRPSPPTSSPASRASGYSRYAVLLVLHSSLPRFRSSGLRGAESVIGFYSHLCLTSSCV